MSLPFQMKLATAAFAVALTVFVAGLWLAHQHIDELTTAAEWRQHTFQVLAEIRAVKAGLVDADTGARGFVITGEERFLEPYQLANLELPRRVDNLRRLISDNPAQRERVSQTETLMETLLGFLDELIRVRRDQGLDSPIVRGLVASGKRTMDELRVLIKQMEQAEESLLSLRERAVERRTRQVDVALLASGAIGVTLLLGAFLGFDREVRLRRAAEGELRASQQQLEAFFDVSQDMAVIAGFDGFFKRVNPSWQRVLGYTPAEMTQKPFAEFLHPDDRERTAAEYAEQVGRGKVVLLLENRYRRKDGSYRWLQWTSQPDVSSGLIYAIARDVTEQKQIQEEIVRARDAAETASKELEAFSYAVSHDLRAPLRGIDGFSQALLEDYAGKLDAQGQDYLRRVRAGAQRMAQLIDDMLKLSRISRAELSREPVDLSALARSVATEVSGREPGRAATLRVQEGLVDEGDSRLLRVAFENLLANAWKFTRKKPDGLIEFGAEARNGGPVVYFVRDNGAGFDMQYADRLFGAFQRLHPSHDFEGTGIGLATVARVIGRHGGRIWAEAAPEQGATFFFTLGEGSEPAAPPEA